MSARRGILLERACAFLVATAVAYAAWNYENGLNISRPAILRLSARRASHPHGRASRVVWLMVDGLRLDASRTMAALNRLRADGCDVSARAEFPTLSEPNFVAQASGIEPAASGVRTNDYAGEVRLDSVFRGAKVAGLRTAVVTTERDPGIAATYASWVDDVVVGEPGTILPSADLVFAHVEWVDRAAHAHGGASAEYRAAVSRADDTIRRVAAKLDPRRDALVITSDHGNLDEGGHGGLEPSVVRIPIVVWGAGAVRGTRGSGRGRDIGPTIAALLGVGPLAHATGRPLVPGDAATARQRAAAQAAARRKDTRPVGYVPGIIPVAVAALLLLSQRAPLSRRGLTSAPTYGLVFGALLLATRTCSFSVSNDMGLFGVRVTALSAVAALVQVCVGGRASLVPAALAASLAAFSTAAIAAHQPPASVDATLCFLPIPALTALAFVCFVTAAIGRRDDPVSGAQTGHAPHAIPPVAAPAGAAGIERSSSPC